MRRGPRARRSGELGVARSVFAWLFRGDGWNRKYLDWPESLQAAELVKKFNGLAHVRIPGVVKWRYTFENDWSGDPAIFFWVTLTDEASEPVNLRKTKNAFHCYHQGLFAYHNFRSQSEQATLKDEVYE